MRRAALLLAALGALLLAAPAWAQPVVPASAPGTVECTTGPSFSLIAKDGRILTPDGASIYMWGFALDDADDTFQMPGPTLCVSQGTTVTITLTNNLPALNTPGEPGPDAGPPNTSLVFPGQSGVTSSGGTGSGLLANEAAPGGTVTYSFVASRPGTYIYESGTEPSRQIEMGLYGAIIVRPALGANYAYNDPATQFDPEREYLLLLHDIDPDLHRAVDRGQAFDITQKHDRYWTITGRSFPDSIADNNVPWLRNQPYGSLVWVEMDAALPALIRYANAGLSNHPFHPHGNHLRVIARDGALLEGPAGQDASMEAFTKTIGSGQTYDLLFRFEDDEGYSPSSPVQFDSTDVVFPGLLNTFFKDDLSFYSGSPYLGTEDDLPVAVTRLNECGEFYFPWHSHALNEFQNFDEGFGGLATLLRVDPVGGCPEAEPEAPFATAPPVISGLAIEEQTITATDGTWLGTPPISFTRQWQRLVGVVWTTVPGATGSMYTVTGADVGMRLRICVTAMNSAGSATLCSAPTAPVKATLRLSFTGGGTIGGVGFADEDIVSFNGTGFSLLFDGSDVIGATNAAAVDLDAFAFIDEDSILISFDEALPASIPGFGGLDDSDAARFDATSLGATTTGTLSRFFDGSDVGLTSTNENIDSIQLLPGPGLGSVLISTSGPPGLPGLTGEQDEDVFRLTPTSLGAVTAGTWSYYFDGSDVGLGTADSEDVDSAWVAGNGGIYLSTLGAFAVPGLSGDDDDVFVFTPSSLGATTAGTFASTLQFDAGAHGQGGNNVDAAGRRTSPVVSAPVAAARAAAPKVTATGKLRGRTLTVTARATRCSPCKVQAKVQAPGRKLQTLAMRWVGGKYVAVAGNLTQGRTAYYAVARDLDSRRTGSSSVRQARVGAAALVTFDLCADEGSVTLPGAGAVPIWGLSQDTGGGCGPAQLPGPQLVVNEGDVVTINLTNNLDTESTSLVFPGHTLAPDTVGASPGGGTTSYTFTAANPGVYLYETGVDTQIQLPMGLYGALVVRPALGPSFAYNDVTSQFDVEAVLVLSELDTDLNTSPGTFDPLDWDPDYWLINGQAHPDVPDIAAGPGSRVALRYLDAGQEHHTMTLLGLRQRIIGRDSFQPVARPDVTAETIAVGSTADAIAVVPVGSSGLSFPLYSRQLTLTNGPLYPGGMLTFIAVP